MRPRFVRIIAAALFGLLVVFAGVSTYVVLDNAQVAEEVQAFDQDADCRARQSSDFNEEAWREMALLLVTAFDQNEKASAEHARNLANLTPITDRIDANCDV